MAAAAQALAPGPPDTVLGAARKVFLKSGTLEMRALARELGIGRATLYRWKGSREDLLSEVLVTLAAANLRRAEAEVTTPSGPLRVLEIHGLHIGRIRDNAGLRHFLRREPEVAGRVLLDSGGRVHLAVTAMLADLVRREEAASGWTAPLGADALAAVVARLTEAFIYGDLIARDKPDTETPQLVFRMMLGL
jgi:AcrR family transcriptional regulator